MIELGVHRIRPAWFRFRHNCRGIGARGCNPRYHRGTTRGSGGWPYWIARVRVRRSEPYGITRFG